MEAPTEFSSALDITEGENELYMDNSVASFVIYIINEIANQKGVSPSAVYRALSSSGCINSYLVPFYDVLHTMSSAAVVDDSLKYVSLHGGSI